MQITIVGLGQIGSSLAAALKRTARVAGIDRRPDVVRTALRRRLVHEASTDLDVVRRADVVVLATPVRTLIRQLAPVAKLMKPGAILTDVGSTKEAIVRALPCAAPRAGAKQGAKSVDFVPGHPLAGSEKAGIDACDPALFRGRPWILLPGRGRDVVARLVRSVGARPVLLASARDHDRIVAECSHLPHLIAYALLDLGADLRFTGGSFRDATRVALSDPAMVLDFLLTNARLRPVVDRFVARLRALSRADEKGLRNALHRARARRSTL